MRGVSDAVHQSFTSEEEAKRLFEQETARGNTKVVGNDASEHFPYTSLSARESPRSSPSRSLHARNPSLNCGSPSSRNSQRRSTHGPEYASPAGYTISRSPSESSPSSSLVYLGYKPKAHQQTVSNKSTTRTLPTHEEQRTTRAVVQTPSWLTTSYPPSDNRVGDLALSPLSKKDALSPIMSPKHLIQDFKRGHFGHSPRISSRVKTEPESYSRSPSFDRRKCYNYEAQGSPIAVQPQHGSVILYPHPHICRNCNDSSVLDVPLPLGLVQPMHVLHTVHKPSNDPRSPMTKRSTVPISTK